VEAGKVGKEGSGKRRAWNEEALRSETEVERSRAWIERAWSMGRSVHRGKLEKPQKPPGRELANLDEDQDGKNKTEQTRKGKGGHWSWKTERQFKVVGGVVG